MAGGLAGVSPDARLDLHSDRADRAGAADSAGRYFSRDWHCPGRPPAPADPLGLDLPQAVSAPLGCPANATDRAARAPGPARTAAGLAAAPPAALVVCRAQ